MIRRPSVFVLALTVGDYLLWNWSLNANHDVIALASGLTLPPLVLVSFWILALGAMRLLATVVRRPAAAQMRPRSAGAERRADTHGVRTAQAAEAAREDSPRIAA